MLNIFYHVFWPHVFFGVVGNTFCNQADFKLMILLPQLHT